MLRETPVRFVVGSRQLLAVPRRLMVVGHRLDQLVAGEAAPLPPLADDADGYRVLSAPAATVARTPRETPRPELQRLRASSRLTERVATTSRNATGPRPLMRSCLRYEPKQLLGIARSIPIVKMDSTTFSHWVRCSSPDGTITLYTLGIAEMHCPAPKSTFTLYRIPAIRHMIWALTPSLRSLSHTRFTSAATVAVVS